MNKEILFIHLRVTGDYAVYISGENGRKRLTEPTKSVNQAAEWLRDFARSYGWTPYVGPDGRLRADNEHGL